MKYIKKIAIALTCSLFIGCGGNSSDNTQQTIQDNKAIEMKLNKVYTMQKGTTISEKLDAIVEIKTDLLTGVTTTKLTSGSASISYN